MGVTPKLSRPRRILVVDRDVGKILRWRHDILLGAPKGQHEMLAAAEAEGALRLFAAKHPDLIIIGSEEAATRILPRVRASEGDRHTGVICVGIPTGVQCLESGADDFLAAGYDPSELRARVRAALRLKAMHDELRGANHRLRILSLTDELTGLANMRSFGQRYSEMMRQCRQGTFGFGIVMMDLDHFKSVNDTTNHLIGSFVISEVGRLLRHSGVFGAGDIGARYGGDEFIAAIVADNQEQVNAKAERIREMIAGHSFEKDGTRIRITSSIGVAWVPDGYRDAAEEAIKAADLMLYRSKAAGRDRVSLVALDREPQVAEVIPVGGQQPASVTASGMKKAAAVSTSHADNFVSLMKKPAAS